MPEPPSLSQRLFDRAIDRLAALRVVLAGAAMPVLVAVGALLLGLWLLGKVFQGAGVPGVVAGASLLWLGLGWNRRLFQTFPGPSGRPVDRGQAPDLHAALDQARQACRGPRAEAVHLESGYAVTLAATPTFGALGWARHRWVMGAFTLMFFTEREFHASVAWDMAFASSRHGWLGLQAKRLLGFWDGLARQTEPGRVQGLSRAFQGPDRILHGYARWLLAWNGPYLQRKLAETDAAVAAAFGPRTLARVLIKRALAQPCLEQGLFMPWIEARALGSPWPEGPIQAAAAFALRPSGSAEGGYLLEALAGLGPSTPVLLAARLAWLGVEPHLPLAPEVSAFQLLLPAAAVESLDLGFRELLERIGSARAAARANDDARYRSLVTQEAQAGLTPAERRDLAALAETREAPAAYGARLEALTASDPKASLPWYLLAKFHLEQGDPERGRAALATLRNLSPFNEAAAARLLAAFHARLGEVQARNAALGEAIAAQHLIEAAKAERVRFRLTDAMLPPDLPAPALEALRGLLTATGAVRRAYLVRKRVAHLPECPCYFLAVVPRGRAAHSERIRRTFQAQLLKDLAWPEDVKAFVLVFGGRIGTPAAPFERVPGSLIFGKGRSWLARHLPRPASPAMGISPRRQMLGLACLAGLAVAFALMLPPRNPPASSQRPLPRAYSVACGPAGGHERELDRSRTLLTLAETPDFSRDPQAPRVFEAVLLWGLQQGRYAELEQAQQAFCATGARFPGGDWKQAWFVTALAIPPEAEQSSLQDWRRHLDRLQAWVEASPGSEAARVTYADALVEYAFRVDGDGDPWSALTQTFRRKVRQAQALLDGCATRPHSLMWYRTLQRVAYAQGWAPEAYERLFAEAVAAEPRFFPFYEGKISYLSQRQVQAPEAWQTFARDSSDRLGGDAGDALYWWIITAWTVEHPIRRTLDDPQVSWPRMRRGFHAIDRTYGMSTFLLNTYARYASYANDREETRATLARIGPAWDAHAWPPNETRASLEQWLAQPCPEHGTARNGS